MSSPRFTYLQSPVSKFQSIQMKWHSVVLCNLSSNSHQPFFAICFQIPINPNEMTLRCTLQFVFKFTSTFPCNLFPCNLFPCNLFLCNLFPYQEMTWSNPESPALTHVTAQRCKFSSTLKASLASDICPESFAYLHILSSSFSPDIKLDWGVKTRYGKTWPAENDHML